MRHLRADKPTLRVSPEPVDGPPRRAAGARQEVVCVLCGVVSPARVRVIAGEVAIGCVSCGGEWRLGAPPLARGTTPMRPVTIPIPPEVDPASCPKCRTAVSARDAACRRCGLARRRFPHFQATSAGASAALDAAWAEVEAGWDDPVMHDRFIERVVDEGQFMAAAARYRAASEARPGDPIAAARLEQLRRAVEVVAFLARPEAPPPRRVLRWAAILLVVLAFGGAAQGARVLLRREQPAVVPQEIVLSPVIHVPPPTEEGPDGVGEAAP